MIQNHCDPGMENLWVGFYVSIYIFVCLSISVYLYHSLSISMCISISIFIYLSIHPSIYLSMNLYMHRQTCVYTTHIETLRSHAEVLKPGKRFQCSSLVNIGMFPGGLPGDWGNVHGISTGNFHAPRPEWISDFMSTSWVHDTSQNFTKITNHGKSPDFDFMVIFCGDSFRDKISKVNWPFFSHSTEAFIFPWDDHGWLGWHHSWL